MKRFNLFVFVVVALFASASQAQQCGPDGCNQQTERQPVRTLASTIVSGAVVATENTFEASACFVHSVAQAKPVRCSVRRIKCAAHRVTGKLRARRCH